MGAIASQITSLTSVYSTVYSDADQRKHQSSASLAFVRGFHRGAVNSPHKWPVTRKMFPFDDVIMRNCITDTPPSFSHCSSHLLKTITFSVRNRSDSVHMASFYGWQRHSMCKKLFPFCWMRYWRVFQRFISYISMLYLSSFQVRLSRQRVNLLWFR